jgi:hypothetical protein
MKERNGECLGAGCGASLRLHIDGTWYINGRIATDGETSGALASYPAGNNFRAGGTCNAGGMAIDRLADSSAGDSASGTYTYYLQERSASVVGTLDDEHLTRFGFDAGSSRSEDQQTGNATDAMVGV